MAGVVGVETVVVFGSSGAGVAGVIVCGRSVRSGTDLPLLADEIEVDEAWRLPVLLLLAQPDRKVSGALRIRTGTS